MTDVQGLIVLLGSLLITAIALGFIIPEAEEPEDPVPVIELCYAARDKLKAAATCQTDFNCVLTYEDYLELVDVERFGKRYCNDEWQASPHTSQSTGD